jgi:alpha-L-fucosidase
MFLHWAASCIYGGEISWSRAGDPPDSWHSGGKIDPVLYDDSFKIFNPSEYNPDEWVQLAKDASMKYMVLTTRHHDGFSMFDTKYSELKITHPESAYRKWIAGQNPSLNDDEINRKTDLVRQFADAVHKGGLKLGFYYSEPDWVREDYRIALTGRNFKGDSLSAAEQQAAEKEYQDFMYNQLEELTTGYGRVDLIWFDAIKPAHASEIGGKAAVWIDERTLEMIRKNQPGILINDRTGFSPDYVTNELRDTRYIPYLVAESCNKIGDPYWSFSPAGTVKPAQWIIDRLIINAGNNSNLLLNVGPGPDGKIPEMYYNPLLEAGKWLKENGAAIYGTNGGPYFCQECCLSTFSGNKVYILLREVKDEEVILPSLNLNLISARTLSGNAAIEFSQPERHAMVLKLPSSMKGTLNQVIVLEFTESLEITSHE